jgi:hypothetical protein
VATQQSQELTGRATQILTINLDPTPFKHTRDPPRAITAVSFRAVLTNRADS